VIRFKDGFSMIAPSNSCSFSEYSCGADKSEKVTELAERY
jgi:hypothetical protein